MNRAVVRAAYALILFGWLIIFNREIWPDRGDEFDVFGLTVRMTFIALAAIAVGTLILVARAEKKS